jgi:hypothetical protein
MHLRSAARFSDIYICRGVSLVVLSPARRRLRDVDCALLMSPGETSVSAQQVDVEVVSTTKGSSTKTARRSSLQALEDDLTNGGLDMTPSQMSTFICSTAAGAGTAAEVTKKARSASSCAASVGTNEKCVACVRKAAKRFQKCWVSFPSLMDMPRGRIRGWSVKASTVHHYVDPTCPSSDAARRYFGWMLLRD